mgnify:CR=1 FL=1
MGWATESAAEELQHLQSAAQSESHQKFQCQLVEYREFSLIQSAVENSNKQLSPCDGINMNIYQRHDNS